MQKPWDVHQEEARYQRRKGSEVITGFGSTYRVKHPSCETLIHEKIQY
jgi:hypothetical protein